MVAGDVVPVDTVVVELVQDGQAVLGGTALDSLTVVRLRFSNAARMTWFIKNVRLLVSRNVYQILLLNTEFSILNL